MRSQLTKPNRTNAATIALMLVLLVLLTPLLSFAAGQRLPYPDNVGDTYMGIFYGQPGLQMIVYPYYVGANSLWDARGDKVKIDLDAEGVLLRPAYAIKFNEKFTWLLNGVVPLGRVSIRNPVTGERETRSGVGDLVLAPSMWFKLDEEKRFGMQLDCLMYFPTGDYKKGRLANMGTNQFSVEPLLVFVKGWRLASKELYTEIQFSYLFNGENTDEHFKQGDMAHVLTTFALMKGNLTMGLTVNHAASVNEDELNGNKVPNSKVRLTEIGPSISYQVSPKLNLYVRVLQGVEGENTAKATTVLAKIWFPF